MEESILASYLEQLEHRFEEFLREKDLAEELTSCIYYVFASGGKRLRPKIVMGLGRDLGVSSSTLLNVALGIELLHSASLIHDDLPALDNDDFRRGKESAHKKFAESTAVLAGDILVPMALELCLSNTSDSSLANRFAQTLLVAYQRVCNGQQLDLGLCSSTSHAKQRDLEKTGALFGACFLVPVIASQECGVDQEERFYNLGLKFGLAFQAKDDLEDLAAGISHSKVNIAKAKLETVSKSYFDSLALVERTLKGQQNLNLLSAISKQVLQSGL